MLPLRPLVCYTEREMYLYIICSMSALTEKKYIRNEKKRYKDTTIQEGTSWLVTTSFSSECLQ